MDIMTPSQNGEMVKPSERSIFDLQTMLTRAGFGRAELSESQKACIMGKLPLMLDAGRPRNQAIAIAMSECAPEVARTMARSTSATAALFSSLRLLPEENEISRDLQPSLPGRDLVGIQNADGTWNVPDIPVMAEHIMPEDGKTYIGRKWMERCSAIIRTRMNNNEDPYTPPFHLIHHGSGDVERIGSWIPKDVRTINYAGAPTDCLFADIICMPDHHYQAFRRGDIPYVSIESYDVTSYEVDSLAALDHDAPFFKFGNNRVIKEFPHPDHVDPSDIHREQPKRGEKVAWDYRDEECGPLLGVATDGVHRHSALFKFDYSAIQEEQEMTKEATPTAVNRMAEGEGDGAGSLTLDDAVKYLKEIMPKLQEILTLANVGEAEAAPIEDEMPAEMPEEEVLMEGEHEEEEEKPVMAGASRSVEDAANQTGLHAQMARMSNQLKTLVKKDSARDAEIEIQTALNTLTSVGCPEEMTRKALVAFRATSKAEMDKYVELTLEQIGEDPPTAPDGGMRRTVTTSAFAMKYRSGGPEAIRMAEQLEREWETMSRSMTTLGPKNEFVTRRLVKAGLYSEEEEG